LDINSFLGRFEGMFVGDMDCDFRQLWAIRDDMVKEEIVQGLMGWDGGTRCKIQNQEPYSL
jgi:hypothetical protein